MSAEAFAANRVCALLEAQPEVTPNFYAVLAEVSVQNRLYPEARDFAEQRHRARPASPGSRTVPARAEPPETRRRWRPAARAWRRPSPGDPYNVWIKNTLDLLDKLPDYVVTETPRFRLVIHEKESDLLAPILGELAERAYDALAARYDFRPATPIRIEVYEDHADFSVRTVGLAGLGALGVSFGPVIAIDSPGARDLGSFNFGVTFWHELAHTFTLGYTDNKIPRWLTEGLSVYEEHQSGQVSWGDDPSREFLAALAEDKLLSLIDLNAGFVRPTFPNQIGLSYYQASLICELVVERYGWDRMLALLRGYRDGLDTAQTVEKNLEKSLEDFNAEYFEWLRQRFEKPLLAFGGPEHASRETLAAEADEHPENYRMQLARAAALVEEEKYEEAIPYLERAKQLFPTFVGAGNAYSQLAAVYEQLERPDEAVRELTALTEIDEYSYLEHRRLAELLSETGDADRESIVLDRARYIYPYDLELHERLAELAESRAGGPGEHTAQLIRARRAILALKPANRAQAHYSLARALLLDGRSREARREVLSALELAPGYAEAQDLLLELVSAGEGSG